MNSVFDRTSLVVWASVAVATLGSIPSAALGASPNQNVDPRPQGAPLAEIEARREALFARMLAAPADLDVAFEYAALSSKAGDLEAAIATLERMLIFAPGLPRLQLELGVLYFRLGAYETARTYFDAALSAPDVPEEVRGKVQPYMAMIDRKATGMDFGGAISAGVRYQSNANTGPASRLVSLNGLDYLLSSDAAKSSDVNVYLSGNAGFSFDLPGQGDRFDVSLATFGARHADRRELDVVVGEVTAGPVFDLGRFGINGSTVGIYGIASGALLDGQPYLGATGLGGVYTTGFAEGVLAVRGEYRYEAYRNSTANSTASNKDGDRFKLQASYERRLTESVSVLASMGAERLVARTDFSSFWQVGGLVGVSIDHASPIAALPAPWSLNLTAELYARDYDRPDTMISSKVQKDTDLTFRALQKIPLGQNWSLQLQASYRKVWSNYDTRKFDNVTAGIGLQKAF